MGSASFPRSSGSDGLGQGESLSVNGCCLTLREDADEEASFDFWKKPWSVRI